MKKILMITIVTMVPVFISNGKSGGCCQNQSSCNVGSKIESQKTSTPPGKKVKEVIQAAYGNVAKEGSLCSISGGCCGGGGALSELIGYSADEIDTLANANLGLGCGHPVGLAQIREGDTVLDLGSGAGLDCFLAAKKTGPKGTVIGVDMTQEMIDKARANAKQYNFANVEFRLGDIENLPVASNAVDIVISNCVINLAPDKAKVFAEAYRVLKPGGKMSISDIVLTRNLTPTQKQDERLLSACVSGAILKQDYINLLKKIGFTVTVAEEDKEIGKKWFGNNDLPIVSLKFIAHKK